MSENQRNRRVRRSLASVCTVLAGAVTGVAGAVGGANVATADMVPVAAYEMNERTTGTGRIMVDSGPFRLDGRIGDSIEATAFPDGASGYRWSFTDPDRGPLDPERLATVDSNEQLNPGGAEFAVEIRYRTSTSFGNIVQKGQSHTDGGYWKLEHNDGFPTCLFRRDLSDQAAVVGPVRTNDGEWHTIRCERRDSHVRMLVDGQEVDRRTRTVGAIANSFPMTIGGKQSCNQSTVGCDYFSGEIDWVRIHKVVPSTPNQAPIMSLRLDSCVALTCTFDSRGSYDPDGQIVDRAWDFGDGLELDQRDTIVTHSFAEAGTYRITVVGTDDDGATSAPASVDVTVSGPPNDPPVMAFTAACTDRACTFDSSASSDPDGTITNREWAFGDGSTTTSSSSIAAHTYETAGVYTVRLTGRDDGGAVHTATLAVTVEAPSALGSTMVPLPPQRVFDTRPEEPAPGPKGVVRGGTSIDVAVTGVAGVPRSNVTAVAINITAIGIEAPGFVSARPSDVPEIATSSLNLVNPGEVRSNMVIVPVSASGTINLVTIGDAHLLGDIAGYFAGAVSRSDAGRIVTQVPRRLLDTRVADAGGSPAVVPTAGTISVPVLGHAGVPADGVAAVVLNITATESAGPSFVTVWPSGRTRPIASSINVNRAGETVANQVIVPVGAGGSIDLFTLASGHVVIDVAGYVTSDDAPVTSTGLFVPLHPSRVFDTRPGEAAGGPKGLVPADSAIRMPVGGVTGIPETAGGVVLNVTLIGTAPGFVTLWPTGSDRPATSTVNVSVADDVRPNGAIVRLGDAGQLDAYVLTPAHVLGDVFGYLTA